MNNLQKCIAHRGKNGSIQTLECHLEEVSDKTGKFAAKIGLKEQGELIGLLHDIGKASEEFQRYIQSATGLINSDEDDYVDTSGMKGKIDHSSAGAQIIARHLLDKGNETVFAKQLLSLCIASHHSGLINCIAPDGTDVYSKRMSKPTDKTHFDEIYSKIDDAQRKRIEQALQSKDITKTLKDQLNNLCEKNRDSKETLMFKYGLMVRFLYSCLIDADRLSTADFDYPATAKIRNNGNYISWSELIKRFRVKLRSFKGKKNTIDKLRQNVSDHCREFADKPKGLYQLTVPTGGGKTLSSLRFALHHAQAHGMDRIMYVLPYTTIIDQNADEVRQILEDKDETGKYAGRVVLEHHSNLTPDEETVQQKVLAEDWDAPVVFTTVVQVLDALFGSGTQTARRMHQLADAVIIFDEVQSLPIKCVQMFNLAIRFLVHNCGSTVVLCTATQPLLNQIKPESRALTIAPNQQIIPDIQKLFKDLKRVKVIDRCRVEKWNLTDIKILIAQELKIAGSVLVIVNTKKAAREIYQQCNNDMQAKVYHLSTYMCPAHRTEKLREITAGLENLKNNEPNKEPIICVSTQLIEAGVDIDFGAVIRSLAGLDSMAQAAGRCNRHNERGEPGRVTIINPVNENIDEIKEIRIGREKAERVLGEYKKNPDIFDRDILGHKAIECYYQYYFYDRTNDMNYPVSSKSVVKRNDNLFILLSTNTTSIGEYKRINKVFPAIPLRYSFMAAAKTFNVIDSPARGIVVPYGQMGREIINKLCSAFDIEKQYLLIKEAQRYSVNLFENDLKKLGCAVCEVQKGSGILYLDERYYSDDFGISEKPVNEMGLLNR
ncbi:MAG: CRISPR-associated helicase Cas3' [Elusimicrobiota bacterium]